MSADLRQAFTDDFFMLDLPQPAQNEPPQQLLGTAQQRPMTGREALRSSPNPHMGLDTSGKPHANSHVPAQTSRQPQVQDDIKIRRRSGSRQGGREKDTLFKRDVSQLNALRRELAEANARLQEANDRIVDANGCVTQAERAAREWEDRVRTNLAETVSKGGDLGDALDVLKNENRRLKVELDDARSHIFSLQPYRKDLIPEEVGIQYDDLVGNVTDWVTRVIEPVLNDPAKRQDILEKKPYHFSKLNKYIQKHSDLSHGCLFPETDIDILIAIVMRFLNDHIFQPVLAGMVPGFVDIITYVETSMQSVQPKRDLFALRTWKAEALNAVLHTSEYQTSRPGHLRELTVGLANMFQPLWKDMDSVRFAHILQDSIVRPAMELKEKMATSTHHFYLDLNPFVVLDSSRDPVTSPDFFDNLPKLRCENIMQNRKPFNITKMDPCPTRAELCEDLVNVASVVPALYMRQIGQGDAIKAPVSVRRQQVLVAWGSRHKREKLLGGEQTLLAQIYHPSPRKYGPGFWKGIHVPFMA